MIVVACHGRWKNGDLAMDKWPGLFTYFCWVYELVQIRNFWFDIDRNGVTVAHVSKTARGWEVVEKDSYEKLAGPFKKNKDGLRWYKERHPEPERPKF